MEEPKLRKKRSLMDKSVKEQRKVLIIATVFLVTLFFGSSYALLSFTTDSNTVVNVATGNMETTITTDKQITLNGKIPETDASGLENADPVKITIANTGNLNIAKYVVTLIHNTNEGITSNLDYQYIKYAISEDGENYISPRNLGGSNNIIYIGYDLPATTNNTKEFYIKVWLDENAESSAINKQFTGSVKVEAYSSTSDLVANLKSNNTSSTCQNPDNIKWVDTDGTTYISGSKECIDFNYLWYSGKLWRIVAIYPDGRMKLVTEDAITAIYWGSDTEYDGSYMYQWLNEDFKDTLINPDTILENATWNYSTAGSLTPVRPETIETQKTKKARVGLLNAYEYYNAYRNSSMSGNYLNIGYSWWLITPYSDSYVIRVDGAGNTSFDSPLYIANGTRPSVIFQSGISLYGSGTKNNPYMVVGNDYANGNVGDNLYDRNSGEYVRFDGDLYRIVSTENSITKINRNDILRDETSTSIPKTAITKNFASSAYFGKEGNTQGDTYWDSYLNNTWYNSISQTYKNMMVDGTYYLGLCGNVNYKATICKDSATVLNTTTTKNCTRYPNPGETGYDANKIYIGKVGLPRVGEMFSAQLGGGSNVSSTMWLITPYSWMIMNIKDFGVLSATSPSSSAGGARPSINLKSEVKIACNSLKCDGTESYPYDLTM